MSDEINLTAAVEAAAEASWSRRARWNQSHGAVNPIEWAHASIPAASAHRIMIAAAVVAACPHIAHQAWEIGADDAMSNVLNADVADTDGPTNPWPDPELEAL